MNGEIKRGEVYWVSVDGSIGFEVQTGRPAVVISGDKSNAVKKTVVVAFLSSAEGAGHPHFVTVYVDGKHQRIFCDQIRTVDKQRLTKYVGVLTESDMSRVTGAVANVLCIPILTAKSEETVVAKPPANGDVSVAVERDMYRRMYEKVLDELVAMRVSADMETRVAPEEVAEEEETSDGLSTIDINSCDKQDLVKNGWSSTAAHSIVANRPYKSVEDLRTVPGVTKIAYGVLKTRLRCDPIPAKKEEKPKPTGKVNVNTATSEDLVAVGVSERVAINIRAYRNKHGKFSCLEELLDVPRFGKTCMKKYGPMLEV